MMSVLGDVEVRPWLKPLRKVLPELPFQQDLASFPKRERVLSKRAELLFFKMEKTFAQMGRAVCKRDRFV